jgi:regulatory protein
MNSRTMRTDRTSSSAPDRAALHDAALTYLARYAATEAGLRRVLERRIERWARAANGSDETVAAAKQVAGEIAARLAAAGAVSDSAFAESRARRLARAGHSRRAIAAALVAKGVDGETVRRALPSDETELASALALARRRRIGPFRAVETLDAAGQRRELGVLARAGFPQNVARRALAMSPEEAAALVDLMRR